MHVTAVIFAFECNYDSTSTGFRPYLFFAEKVILGKAMCHYVSSACNSACRAIKTLRDHNRTSIGIEARQYLICVERWLVAWTCRTPFAVQVISEDAGCLHNCSSGQFMNDEEGARYAPHFRSSLSLAAEPAEDPTQ